MSTYIDVPIEVDPSALAQLAFDDLQAAYPGWAPADGNLDTVLIEVTSRIAAVVATLASQVPTSVARFFGPLLGVVPIDASSASVATTWTMVAAGHIIPAGTIAGIADAAGTLIPFQTLTDVTVLAGDTVTGDGEVLMVAVTAGSSGSGLGTIGGPAELVNTLEYVTSIVQTTVSSGGVDAETDTAYLNRFVVEAQLLAPRPIIPSDYAALSEDVAGVARALALDLYVPAVNEVETVTINATGGTFTITFTGQTTAAIAWNAAAADVQAALEALSNIAPGDVTVTGGPGGTAAFTVEFCGAYAGTDVTQMTTNAASLTGGASTATVATVTGGAVAVVNSPRTVTVVLVDANGNPVTSGTKTAVQTLLASKREVNFLVYVIDPTYTSVDVSFTVTTVSGYDAAGVVAAAAAAVTSYLSPGNWGLPTTGDQAGWIDTPVVRLYELATVINNVQGVDHITALTLGAHGGSLTAADFALTGPAAMPTVGTITGAAA